MHKQCYASRCFKGSRGKTLNSCKYGFPFNVPEPCEKLDSEKVRYLYKCTLKEDALVVPYNPEIAILWGACTWLNTFPSLSLVVTFSYQRMHQIPNGFFVQVIGSVEAHEVMMGFHQSQMSRQVLFLHTELNPTQRMLKPKFQLKQLDDDDCDLQTKLQTYLKRPTSLHTLTYPEFCRWWRPATVAENKKASEVEAYSIQCKGSDDFQEFVCAKEKLDSAHVLLSEVLADCEVDVSDGHDLLALCRALQRLGIPQCVFDAVERHCNNLGIESLPPKLQECVH